MVIVFSEFVTAAAMAIVIIPVFYKLQITSSYEYLNKRFSPTVRTLGSFLFLCKMVRFSMPLIIFFLNGGFKMLYIPIVIYVPALAFSQVSGFSLEALIPAVCIVCIFYTSLVSSK